MPDFRDIPSASSSHSSFTDVQLASVHERAEQTQQVAWLKRCTRAFLLLGQVILRIMRRQVQQRQLTEHLIAAGPQSLLPLLLTNGFAGMIFTIQTARELEPLGAINAVGGAFAIAFCRELAPILSAGILAGQVGSAFAAELGSMKITEQIDALYMLRTDPVDYLVVPRVIACSLMLPIMTVIALFIGIVGGCAIATQFYSLPLSIFLESVRSSLTLSDVLSILLKGWLFGIMIAIIGCSWGLTTQGGVKGVGQSATSAVVTIWVSIFIVDFCLSWAIFHELMV
ncbi:MAG: MlaE family lipid ABC transporter permease subunit [Thainema sp.]